MVQIGLEEAFPLFALSTPDVGGLGWNTAQIGKVTREGEPLLDVRVDCSFVHSTPLVGRRTYAKSWYFFSRSARI